MARQSLARAGRLVRLDPVNHGAPRSPHAPRQDRRLLRIRQAGRQSDIAERTGTPGTGSSPSPCRGEGVLSGSLGVTKPRRGAALRERGCQPLQIGIVESRQIGRRLSFKGVERATSGVLVENAEHAELLHGN